MHVEGKEHDVYHALMYRILGSKLCSQLDRGNVVVIHFFSFFQLGYGPLGMKLTSLMIFELSSVSV